MFDLMREINSIDKMVKQKIDARLGKPLPKKESLPETPDDIIEWVKSMRKIKGGPFSFEGRDHLLEIYQNTNPRIAIVKPRQTEITEFAVNWLLFNLIKNPGTIGLYVSDRQQHVSGFSRTRMKKAIADSPILRKMTYAKGNISLVEFKNGSLLYMISAIPNFESARSYPADFVVVDEIQSTNVKALPVLEETLAKSNFGRCIYIGTGSVTDDGWHKKWKQGDQREYDSTEKKWIPKNPGATMASYHISEEMISKTPELEESRKNYSPRMLANEVRGEWYGGAGKPFVELDIRKLFDNALDFVPSDNVDHDYPIFAGFDWGGGTQAFTVAWIWQLVNRDVPRFKVLNITRIDDSDTEIQADKAIELIEKYRIDKIVCDSGGGTRQAQKLSKRYPGRVYKCHYVPNSDEPINIISNKNQVHVDRTWLIESLINLIKVPEITEKYPGGVPRVHIPHMNASKVDWIVEHFTCIEAETVEEGNRGSYVKYVHPEETKDDALHAACYAYLAWVMTVRQRWVWY